MKLIKPTLAVEHTAASQAGRGHDAWDPDWDEHRFVALLHCTQTDCLETVSIAGSRRHDVYQVAWSEHEEEHFFRPRSIFPAVPLFRVPVECPEQVEANIVKAFELFWIDLGACANRLRIAIERLLDDRRINKTNGKPGSDRRRLTAHARIEKLGKSHRDAASHLLAIKWIGNEGAHQGDANRDDILDAFELIEAAVEEIYVRSKADLKRKATAISRRKGKPRKAGI
tara:strand:+ start:1615 stop:2295 length:681 start_codon:yes stop_codon:yes gene_type:complete